MKLLTSFLARLASAAVGALVVYLLGAFVAASFDITTWSDDHRTMIGGFMLIGMGLGILLCFADYRP